MGIGDKVVVCTEFRGVFYGTLVSQDGTDVTLRDSRVCVYWSKTTRGFVGLAATGPLDGSRVSRQCPEMRLAKVTCILLCTQEAVAVWESSPWNE